MIVDCSSCTSFPWAALSVIIACSSAEPRIEDWSNVADSTQIRTVRKSRSICTDCIVVKRVVLIGDTAPPGNVGWTQFMTCDSAGNYWVGHGNTVKVFDSLGQFRRSVGGSGRGLTFRQAEAVFTDGTGGVHIVDPENRRETVVSSEFGLLAERPFPPVFGAKAPLADGERYVINAWLPTAERIGLPLHIVDASEFVHSFGFPGPDAPGPMTAFSSRRVLAVDRVGHIFAAPYYEYVVEVWSASGRRIIGFRGPVLNHRPVRPGAVTDSNPPPNQLWAMQVDDAERLWIATLRVKEEWRAHMEEVLLPNGELRLRQSTESPRAIYGARIDVIDLNTSRIIASAERQELITAFVGPGLGLEVQYADDGIPQLVLWRLSLVTRLQQ